MNLEFIPKFNYSLLRPKYWATWAGVFFCITMALLPVNLRDHFLGNVGKWIGRLTVNIRRRAHTNLLHCMPELTTTQREKVMDDMFSTMLQSKILAFDLAFNGKIKIEKRIIWHGNDVIANLYNENTNAIFLAPQGIGVDIPAMLISSCGKNISTFVKENQNPVICYISNRLKKKFNIRLHHVKDGIKPFIKSVRNGYWGYFTPDNEVCNKFELVNFFATYKATSPTVGRLMKMCPAKIVPIFSIYNSNKHQLEVFIRPPLDDLQDADFSHISRRINNEIEYFIKPSPEHYNWTSSFLKIRKPREEAPY